MTTKTINVSPEDAKEGDLFTGTIEYAEGVTLVVKDAPLRPARYHNGKFAVSGTPSGNYATSREWENVTITREVEVPEFKPGTIIRWHSHNMIYQRTYEGWYEQSLTAMPYKLNAVTDEDFQGWIDNGKATVIHTPEEAS